MIYAYGHSNRNAEGLHLSPQLTTAKNLLKNIHNYSSYIVVVHLVCGTQYFVKVFRQSILLFTLSKMGMGRRADGRAGGWAGVMLSFPDHCANTIIHTFVKLAHTWALCSSCAFWGSYCHCIYTFPIIMKNMKKLIFSFPDQNF